MRILAIIPARGGSKGVPRKNIKLLSGVPLLAYTSRVAKKSHLISKVVLSTDDQEIAQVGMEEGIEVPFLRPSELAQDSTPTLPVLQHALAHYDSKGENFDAVCLLEVTSPFRTLDFLEASITKFISSGADSLVSVLPVPATYNPHWTFEEDAMGFLKIATGESKIIPRRQELPKAYFRDGSIYLTKSEVIRSGSIYGSKTTFLENDPLYYVNIDTFDDWIAAEEWMINNGDRLAQ
jgi:CMP-N-acetylneuraminic acid synthetase